MAAAHPCRSRDHLRDRARRRAAVGGPVEDEVRAALDNAAQLEHGPVVFTQRGTLDDDAPAFVVEDGNYVSARWPGDAFAFARRFAALLDGHSRTQ